MTFAEKLKALRKRKSMTQKELADLSGISCSSIINYENGRRTDPPMSVLFGLANALGVSADAFRTNPQAIAETEGKDMEENRGTLGMTISIAGLDELIRKLTVLEAQLHGAKMMVGKISTAIDELQMQLDNKIKSFERPDR